MSKENGNNEYLTIQAQNNYWLWGITELYKHESLFLFQMTYNKQHFGQGQKVTLMNYKMSL